MIYRSVIISIVFGAAACASAPASAEPSSVGPRDDVFNFSDLEFAVRVPDHYRLREDGAEFRISAKNGRTGEVREDLLVMRPEDVSESDFLREQQKPGHHIGRYGVDPNDDERLNAFRDAILAWKTENGSGEHSLSFSANALGCLERGGTFEETVVMEIYMKTDPEMDFYVLVDEQVLDFSAYPETIDQGVLKRCKD